MLKPCCCDSNALRLRKGPAGFQWEELCGEERKAGEGMFQWPNSKLFLIKKKKKEWRKGEIEMQDKKNLLKAGQSCHANKGFKWKIEEISNKVKQKSSQRKN